MNLLLCPACIQCRPNLIAMCYKDSTVLTDESGSLCGWKLCVGSFTLLIFCSQPDKLGGV